MIGHRLECMVTSQDRWFVRALSLKINLSDHMVRYYKPKENAFVSRFHLHVTKRLTLARSRLLLASVLSSILFSFSAFFYPKALAQIHECLLREQELSVKYPI